VLLKVDVLVGAEHILWYIILSGAIFTNTGTDQHSFIKNQLATKLINSMKLERRFDGIQSKKWYGHRSMIQKQNNLPSKVS
jgi:hypothetical protein